MLRVVLAAPNTALSEQGLAILALISSAGGRAALKMAKQGAGAGLVRALSAHRNGKHSEQAIVLLYSCLADLAVWGRGLAPAFGEAGLAGYTLGLIKEKLRQPKLMIPPLRALAIMCSDKPLCRAVGKAGGVELALALIAANSVQIRSHLPLRHALKLLANLLLVPTNSPKFAARQGPTKLLAAFGSWIKLDTRNRHREIRKAMLQVFSRLVSTLPGKQAFLEANGLGILFEIVKGMTSDQSPQALKFVQACVALLRSCQPSAEVPSQVSPVEFPLPYTGDGAGIGEMLPDSDEDDDTVAQARRKAPGGVGEGGAAEEGGNDEGDPDLGSADIADGADASAGGADEPDGESYLEYFEKVRLLSFARERHAPLRNSVA